MMVRMMIADCTCPICGTDDNVRGFKVGDEFGWWSECLNDHDLELSDEGRVTGSLWFVENKDPNEPADYWFEDDTGRTHGVMFD